MRRNFAVLNSRIFIASTPRCLFTFRLKCKTKFWDYYPVKKLPKTSTFWEFSPSGIPEYLVFPGEFTRIIGKESHCAFLSFLLSRTERDTLVLLMRNLGAYAQRFTIVLSYFVLSLFCRNACNMFRVLRQETFIQLE